MGFEIKNFNVLLYEPEAIKPSLQIAETVFNALQDRDDQLYGAKVIPALADKGLLSFDAKTKDLLEKTPSMPNAILDGIGIDTSDEKNGQKSKTPGELMLSRGEQFMINFAPYYDFGKIPRSLNNLKQIYGLFKEEDIPVVFINAIGNGATPNLEALAGSLILGEFPKFDNSLIIAVDSLRESMPKVLRSYLDRYATSNPRFNNGTYYVPIVDKPGCPEETAGKVVKTILDRLGHIRESGENYKILRKTTNILTKKAQPKPNRTTSLADF